MWRYFNYVGTLVTSARTAGPWTADGINELARAIKLTAAAATAHFCFAMSTQEDKTIIVSQKYQFVSSSGSTNFMVIDERGKHYNVNNSFWFGKWDSLEDWHELREQCPAAVQVYGWRVPFLGMFPTIVQSKSTSDELVAAPRPLEL